MGVSRGCVCFVFGAFTFHRMETPSSHDSHHLLLGGRSVCDQRFRKFFAFPVGFAAPGLLEALSFIGRQTPFLVSVQQCGERRGLAGPSGAGWLLLGS